MKPLQLVGIASALALAAAAHAQVNAPPEEETSSQQPSPGQGQATQGDTRSSTTDQTSTDQPTRQRQAAADDTARPDDAASSSQTQPGQTGRVTTPGTANPAPSTTHREGTMADSSEPGETPTRTADPGTVDPRPATSRAEGTAADVTPPGETPVRGTAASRAPEQVTSRMATADMKDSDRRGSLIMGKGVYNEQGAVLGEVKDFIIDPMTGKVTHAVIATGGSVTSGTQKFTAVPWNEMKTAMHQGRIVMDEARLSGAPSFSSGQWPDLSSGKWSGEADRYWGSRSAAGTTETPEGSRR